MNIRTGLGSLLLFASCEVLRAQEPTLLRRLDAPIAPQDPDSSVLREVAVRVNTDVARTAARVKLPLFDGDRSLELIRTGPPLRRGGSEIWTGRVLGQEASTVIFSIRGDLLIGNVATQPMPDRPAEYYEIRFLGPDHVLRRIDPSKLHAEGNPVPSGPLEEPRTSTCSTDPPGEIDVLVLFTQKAQQRAGGAKAMKESDPGLHRGGESVLRAEPGGPAAAQARGRGGGATHGRGAIQGVRKSRDGPEPAQEARRQLAGAHARRDAVGADLVVLIAEYTQQEIDDTSCGNAFLMETRSNAFESSAFAVVPRRCADRSMSFTHEVGHLMGARHDWARRRLALTNEAVQVQSRFRAPSGRKRRAPVSHAHGER